MYQSSNPVEYILLTLLLLRLIDLTWNQIELTEYRWYLYGEYNMILKIFPAFVIHYTFSSFLVLNLSFERYLAAVWSRSSDHAEAAFC